MSKHSKADLHSYFSKIKSQGEQGACASFSLVSIAEYYLNNFGNKDLDLSEAFLYYNARKINGKCNEDSGVSLGDVVKAMQSEGICVEELCPYNYKVYDQEPSEQAYKDGEKRKAVGAARVQIDPEHIKSAILEGFPVVGCFRVFNSLEHNTSGYVHMPTEEELLKKEMYHAMVICGFNDKSSYFIVRNSWGEDFGDKGYCYLPYAYIRDNTLTCDAIIVKGITAEDSIPTPVYEKTRNKENDPNVKYIVSKNVLDEEIFRLDSIKEQLKKRLLECRDKLASLDFDDIIDKKRDIINSEIENLRQRKEAAILALNNEKFISYKKTNIICGISDILLIGGALYSRIKPGIDAAFPYLLSSSVLMTFCWPLLLLYKIRKNKKHLNNAIKSIDTSIENLNEELANFERFCLNLQCLLEALSNMDSFSNEKTWNLSSLDNLWSEIFNETIDLPDIDKSIVDGIDIPFKLSDFIQRLISEENNADGSNGLSTFKRLQAEILKHLLDNFNLKIEELYPEGSREWNEFIAESDSAKVLADIEYDETESTPIICTLCSNLGTPKLPFQSNHVEIHNNMYIFSIIKYVLPRHLILIN